MAMETPDGQQGLSLAEAIRAARAEILRAADALNVADALLAAFEGQGDPTAAVTAYLTARRQSLYSNPVAYSTGQVVNLAKISTAN